MEKNVTVAETTLIKKAQKHIDCRRKAQGSETLHWIHT